MKFFAKTLFLFFVAGSLSAQRVYDNHIVILHDFSGDMFVKKGNPQSVQQRIQWRRRVYDRVVGEIATIGGNNKISFYQYGVTRGSITYTSGEDEIISAILHVKSEINNLEALKRYFNTLCQKETVPAAKPSGNVEEHFEFGLQHGMLPIAIKSILPQTTAINHIIFEITNGIATGGQISPQEQDERNYKALNRLNEYLGQSFERNSQILLNVDGESSYDGTILRKDLVQPKDFGALPIACFFPDGKKIEENAVTIEMEREGNTIITPKKDETYQLKMAQTPGFELHSNQILIKVKDRYQTLGGGKGSDYKDFKSSELLEKMSHEISPENITDDSHTFSVILYVPIKYEEIIFYAKYNFAITIRENKLLQQVLLASALAASLVIGLMAIRNRRRDIVKHQTDIDQLKQKITALSKDEKSIVNKFQDFLNKINNEEICESLEAARDDIKKSCERILNERSEGDDVKTQIFNLNPTQRRAQNEIYRYDNSINDLHSRNLQKADALSDLAMQFEQIKSQCRKIRQDQDLLETLLEKTKILRETLTDVMGQLDRNEIKKLSAQANALGYDDLKAAANEKIDDLRSIDFEAIEKMLKETAKKIITCISRLKSEIVNDIDEIISSCSKTIENLSSRVSEIDKRVSNFKPEIEKLVAENKNRKNQEILHVPSSRLIYKTLREGDIKIAGQRLFILSKFGQPDLEKGIRWYRDNAGEEFPQPHPDSGSILLYDSASHELRSREVEIVNQYCIFSRCFEQTRVIDSLASSTASQSNFELIKNPAAAAKAATIDERKNDLQKLANIEGEFSGNELIRIKNPNHYLIKLLDDSKQLVLKTETSHVKFGIDYQQLLNFDLRTESTIEVIVYLQIKDLDENFPIVLKLKPSSEKELLFACDFGTTETTLVAGGINLHQKEPLAVPSSIYLILGDLGKPLDQVQNPNELIKAISARVGEVRKEHAKGFRFDRLVSSVKPLITYMDKYPFYSDEMEESKADGRKIPKLFRFGKQPSCVPIKVILEEALKNLFKQFFEYLNSEKFSQADRNLFRIWNIGTLVITHPNSYTPREIALLKEAYRSIPKWNWNLREFDGDYRCFDDVVAINESNAVVYSKLESIPDSHCKILIFDVGGNSYDLSLLEKYRKGARDFFRTLNRTGGELAGNHLDYLIARDKFLFQDNFLQLLAHYRQTRELDENNPIFKKFKVQGGLIPEEAKDELNLLKRNIERFMKALLRALQKDHGKLSSNALKECFEKVSGDVELKKMILKEQAEEKVKLLQSFTTTGDDLNVPEINRDMYELGDQVLNFKDKAEKEKILRFTEDDALLFDDIYFKPLIEDSLDIICDRSNDDEIANPVAAVNKIDYVILSGKMCKMEVINKRIKAKMKSLGYDPQYLMEMEMANEKELKECTVKGAWMSGKLRHNVPEPEEMTEKMFFERVGTVTKITDDLKDHTQVKNDYDTDDRKQPKWIFLPVVEKFQKYDADGKISVIRRVKLDFEKRGLLALYASPKYVINDFLNFPHRISVYFFYEVFDKLGSSIPWETFGSDYVDIYFKISNAGLTAQLVAIRPNSFDKILDRVAEKGESFSDPGLTNGTVRAVDFIEDRIRSNKRGHINDSSDHSWYILNSWEHGSQEINKNKLRFKKSVSWPL